MGRKSREERERRLAKSAENPDFLLRQMISLHDHFGERTRVKDSFLAQVRETRALLCQYNAADLACAISVSELWPANAGSHVKHAFAWCVFLDTPLEGRDGRRIESYADFQQFAEALYATWPHFPILEDFSPEADWGQTTVSLGGRFVPVFYGSSIERVPDFMEAFRISYADVPDALAQMDLVVALQAMIIEAIPHLAQHPVVDAERGHVELPPEDFWLLCRDVLQNIGQQSVSLPCADPLCENFDVGFLAKDRTLHCRRPALSPSSQATSPCPWSMGRLLARAVARAVGQEWAIMSVCLQARHQAWGRHLSGPPATSHQRLYYQLDNFISQIHECRPYTL